MTRRYADIMGDPRCLLMKAIAFETHSDEGVIVGPDRAGLVIVGIKCRVIGGQRANAPSRPHVRRRQALHNSLGAFRRDDAAPKAMAGVGCNGQNLVLVTVKRIGIEPKLLVPEKFVEPREKCGCFGTQFSGAFGLTERIEHLRHPHPSAVNIALKLAECLRPFYQ